MSRKRGKHPCLWHHLDVLDCRHTSPRQVTDLTVQVFLSTDIETFLSLVEPVNGLGANRRLNNAFLFQRKRAPLCLSNSRSP
jgi:hypothetical protein